MDSINFSIIVRKYTIILNAANTSSTGKLRLTILFDYADSLYSANRRAGNLRLTVLFDHM